MIYRFEKKFRILTGFLLDTEYKGKFLYMDPITGEVVKFRPKNLYRSVGYPGSTLWYRAALPGREKPEESPPPVVHDANLGLDGEGFLIIKMKDGRIIEHGKTRRLVHMSKDIERFRLFMMDQVKHLNSDVATLLDVHKEAVPPDAPRIIHPEVFFEPYPDQVITSRLWFFGLITIILIACFALPSSDHPFLLGAGLTAAAILMLIFRIKGIKDYDDRINKWELRKQQFDEKQLEFLNGWGKACQCNEDRDAVLGLALDSFDWPRETNASFEFKNGCEELHLDIDLPRWDELPAQTWKIGQDNVTLERGIMHPYDRRERYVRHVHSLAFLAASISFWSTPGLQTLYLSAFCEDYLPPDPEMDTPPAPGPKAKKKKNTGERAGHPMAEDEIAREAGTGEPVFLLSLKIERAEWEKVDFRNLDKLNPVFVLEDFEMRRELDTQHMILTRITPF